jgi:hypothetical protein
VFAYDQQPISGFDGHPALEPGEALKFVVEDPSTGNQSSTWRIWTGKLDDDIYICETRSGGQWKTSLHNDWGQWRVAMTTEAANARNIQRVVIDEQPRKVPDGGWSEGTAILIPCADLRSPSEQIPRDVLRIRTSPTRSATAVRLLLQEKGVTTLKRVEEAFGLGVLKRPNGCVAYVFAEPTSLSSEQHESLEIFRADARNTIPTEHSGGRFVGVLAVDEQRILVDLALS